MEHPSITIALIGLLGIGSQWLAVRLRMPAIAFMLAAGVLAGPVLGLVDPEALFGPLLPHIVGIAVAVILFEGGLTLSLAELRVAGSTVRRLCTLGALLGWLFYGAACYLVAGLGLTASAVFGGLLVVTGPTVVIPLLRQARLAHRPASAMKWEAIVNDPVGALFAVLAFEFGVASLSEDWLHAGLRFTLGVAAATAIGYLVAQGVVWSFRRGHVAEYLKVPVLLVLVVGVYASTDVVLHESGLLAVTVMGIVLANTRLPSLVELRRFKENVTVLLVSAVFIILAASIDASVLDELDWRAVLFVAVVMLVARPLAVFLSLLRSGLPWREQLLIALIAPRGIVAVAVAGLFGTRLADIGIDEGGRLAALAFGIVVVSVLAAGFLLAPLGRALGLSATQPPGVLILGGNPWTLGLAEALRALEVPVRIVDRNWYRLGPARAAGVPVYHGEILSEAAQQAVETSRFGALVAATDNDDYNALVCTDLGPDLGRDRVFQIGRHETEEGEHHMPASLGGRTLLPSGATYAMLERRIDRGWGFALTQVDEDFGYEEYLDRRHDRAELVAFVRGTDVHFLYESAQVDIRAGDRLITFTPTPDSPIDNLDRPATIVKAPAPVHTLAEQEEQAVEVAMEERIASGDAGFEEEGSGMEPDEAETGDDAGTAEPRPA